jgi:hypothetical protein
MQNNTINQVTNEVINVTKLAEILKGITKSTFCHIVYMVDDQRSKTIKGIKQVQKLVKISHVALNHNYTNKVIKLSGDTSFVAEEMKGKTRICSTLIQSDKTNELMIDGKVLNSEVAKVLGYFHNGNEITEAEAVSQDLWANSYYNPTEPKTMGRGLVSEEDNFRIINTYLSRIKQIKLEGQWYDITE